MAGVGRCRYIPTTLANLVEYYGVRGLERRRVLGRVGEKKKKTREAAGRYLFSGAFGIQQWAREEVAERVRGFI